jgi:5-methylthioadenosine/S-adenosylhomocysteine deaminase
LAILTLDGARQTPLYDVYSHLVYTAKADDVRTVIVNGRVVVDDGKCMTLDAEAILAKAREYREKVLAALNK